MKKDYGVGFSDVMFTKFWMKNNLYDYSEPELINLLKEGIIPPIIAVVDDYLGSGGTFKDYFDNLIVSNPKVLSSKIFFLVLYAAEEGSKTLIEYAREKELDLSIISLEKRNKAFYDNYIFEKKEIDHNRQLYLSLCKKYKVNEKNIFGYKDSEALVSFSYNTPNNTLGVFWSDSKNAQALFKRHRKEQTNLTSMRKEALERQRLRENGVITYTDNKFTYNALMVYIVRESSKFSYDSACKKFGFTSMQMDQALNHLITNEFLVISNGRLVPTEKMKEKTFKSRLRNNSDARSSSDQVKFNNQEKYVPRNFSEIFSGYAKGGK